MPTAVTFTRPTLTDTDSLTAAEFNALAAVSATVPDATTVAVGMVQLAGDLSGAAAAPALAANTVTFAKMQQVATDTLLGRSTAGTGNVETVACTAAGRAMVAAADAAAQAALLTTNTFARCTSQLNSTAVTFADIPGLTLNVTSGVTYLLESHLNFTLPASPDMSGGDFKLTGTATISSLKGVYIAQNQSQQMSSGKVDGSLPLTQVLGAYINTGAYVCDLIFTPSASGTVKWQFAQNSAGGGTSSVYEGSWMRLSKI